MSEQPTVYREDLSRLRPGEVPGRLMHIYEPLAELVTNDWLRPSVWGYKCVSFYHHTDWLHRHKLQETSFEWSSGDVVKSGEDHYELLSASCVYRCGQWCMQWTARRVGDTA